MSQYEIHTRVQECKSRIAAARGLSGQNRAIFRCWGRIQLPVRDEAITTRSLQSGTIPRQKPLHSVSRYRRTSIEKHVGDAAGK